MYSSKILKSRYISVVEPVFIESTVTVEDTKIIGLDDELNEEEQVDPEIVAADIITKAKEEAAALLESYQLQMDEMKQQMLSEVEQYRLQVQKEAYDEGYNQGYLEGKTTFDEAVNAIKQESLELQDNYSQILLGAEDEVINLVIDIAKKVIDEDVKLNKDNLVKLVKQALALSYEKQNALIKISEKDYQYLTEKVPELISQVDSYQDISIKPEPSLNEGDCIIDTSYGMIDLGIDKRFEKISTEFTQ